MTSFVIVLVRGFRISCRPNDQLQRGVGGPSNLFASTGGLRYFPSAGEFCDEPPTSEGTVGGGRR
jgi:hypothetical protein